MLKIVLAIILGFLLIGVLIVLTKNEITHPTLSPSLNYKSMPTPIPFAQDVVLFSYSEPQVTNPPVVQATPLPPIIYTPPAPTTPPVSPTTVPTPLSTPTPTPVPPFVVRPYLVYPKDKEMFPEYEITVNKYIVEMQTWYREKVGKTFTLIPLQIVRSEYDYNTMRCDFDPTDSIPADSTCLNDPKGFNSDWLKYMDLAINGNDHSWPDGTLSLIFSPGGGTQAFGGGLDYQNKDEEKYNRMAVVADFVLEPLSGKENYWGIPCKYSKGVECVGRAPEGTIAHELGHAFGLQHSAETEKSVMYQHWEYPDVGLLPREIEFLQHSPFFK